MKVYLLFAPILTGFAFTPLAAEEFGNDSVIALSKAGVGDALYWLRLLACKQQAFGGASVGVDPKDASRFDLEEIGDGIFKVSPQSVLAPGEYGFVLRAGSDAYRIYDFQLSG